LYRKYTVPITKRAEAGHIAGMRAEKFITFPTVHSLPLIAMTVLGISCLTNKTG